MSLLREGSIHPLCPGGHLGSPLCLQTGIWAALGVQEGRREDLPDGPVIGSLGPTLAQWGRPCLCLFLIRSFPIVELGSWHWVLGIHCSRKIL